MKIRLFCLAALASVAFVACTTDKGNDPTPDGEKGVAYLSLKIETPYTEGSRASSEATATVAENTINTLKVIVFDKDFKVINYTGVLPVQSISAGSGGLAADGSVSQALNAFKVPGSSKYMLLIANPGSKLNATLTTVSSGVHFNNLNVAIASAVATDEIANTTTGFTMINAGVGATSDTDPASVASLCLIDLNGKVQVVGDGAGQHADATAAITAAESAANRVEVKIERLASKVEVEKASSITLPANVTFNFTGWVLDVVNTTFYPWAKKVDLASVPSGSPAYYAKNFYTIDPNYKKESGQDLNVPGIIYNNPLTVTFPATTTNPVYCIENTAEASSQTNDMVTRVVVKATYHPENLGSTVDWYSYAGATYTTLANLQAAYTTLNNPYLISACDRFLAKLKTLTPGGGGTAIAGGTTFTTLTQAMLDGLNITNGGELVKEDDCIRWYQKGLCYYHFAVKHDNSVTGNNAFAKYGVVRNNWYACTITEITQPGTPWYPEIDPEPVDETEGYISATIKTNPWLKWSTNYVL